MHEERTVKALWKILLSLLFITAIHITPVSLHAQTNQPDDKTITPKMQLEIIDSVSQALNRVYVFPDDAKKMEKFVRKQYKDKKYKDITSLREYTKKLTEDLHTINPDKHLRIVYISDEMIAAVQNDTLTDEAQQQKLVESRGENFGFNELKRLEGNVGYIDFDRFSDTKEAGMTAIAAMNFLAYTDAIIFDLRQNGGGSPSMIQLIMSYFFDEPVHLSSFYVRETDSIQQFWTQTFVQGPRMADVDVYVLTSDDTFSAAEGFTYIIKNLKRGTIIGETTGGGAHPIDRKPFINLNIGMSLPFGRAISPISGTNWEGTGVTPDIEVPADKAMDTAHLEALKKLKEKTTDEDRLHFLQWVIDGKTAILNPVELTTDQMQKYVGVFGPRTIMPENGVLYYQREDRPKYRLIPMGDHTFMLDGLDYFRLQFKADDKGEFNEVIGIYDSGRIDSNERTK
jgi:hypothetical protein